MFATKKRKLCNNDESEDDYEIDNIEKYVVRVNNSIYFYTDVSRESVLHLVLKLKEATQYIVEQNNKTGCEGRVFIHICSEGGSVYDGFAAMDTVKSNKVPVTTIIEGSVCSAASFIALAGETIHMRESAYFLIHQITSAFWGKYEDFNDEKSTLDKLMHRLKTMYAKHTEIPKTISNNMI